MSICASVNAKDGTLANSGALRRLARETTAALVVVFLLFAPYLAQFLRVGKHLEDVHKGRNAFWFMWQPGDLWSLLACIAGITLLAVGVRELLRYAGLCRLLRLYDHVFVLALGGGLLANLWFHTQRLHGFSIGQFGMETQTGWVLLFAAAAYSLARSDFILILRCRQFCQILSPAILIVLWQLMQLPTIQSRQERPLASSANTTAFIPAANRATANHPVYLFIFDEWSYTRTYKDGRLRPEFRNLAELSAQATIFHNAHSPAHKTYESIPSIFRATPDRPEIADLTPGFMSNDRFVPATAYPSIFTIAGCGNYHKTMLQWGFAINIWLDDELDVRHSYSCYPRAEGVAASAALHLYNAAFFWTDPWTNLAYQKLKSQVEVRSGLATYQWIRDDTMRVLGSKPERAFAILHYPLPHPPYIVNADGSYRGYDPKNHVSANVEGYQRNLAYLDTLVGEFVKAIKSAGRFDDCLLILTSDHSWRNDPVVTQPTDENLTHVPLIVKFPGQQQPSRVDADFRTYHLGELIGRGLRGESMPQQVVKNQGPSAIASTDDNAIE